MFGSEAIGRYKTLPGVPQRELGVVAAEHCSSFHHRGSATRALAKCRIRDIGNWPGYHSSKRSVLGSDNKRHDGTNLFGYILIKNMKKKNKFKFKWFWLLQRGSGYAA
jgi:hypothetical protein